MRWGRATRWGLAASFAGGLRQYSARRCEVKPSAPRQGRARRMSVRIGGIGITGAVECLEGKHGLFAAMVGDKGRPFADHRPAGEWHPITSAYFKAYYPVAVIYHAHRCCLDLRPGRWGLGNAGDVAQSRSDFTRWAHAGTIIISVRNLAWRCR